MAGGGYAETIIQVGMHILKATCAFALEQAQKGHLTPEEVEALRHRLIPPAPDEADADALRVHLLFERVVDGAMDGVLRIARQWDQPHEGS